MTKLLGNFVLAAGVIAGGYYLYNKYGGKHRGLIAATAGGLIGERIGYWAGSSLGRTGAIGGSITGSIVGFYAGQKLASKYIATEVS